MVGGSDGAKGVIGGLVGIAVLAGVIYLKFTRSEMRAERREAQAAREDADIATWKEHALEMIKHVPDAKAASEYLTWGVNTFHEEAQREALDTFAGDGATYRDILITKIYDRAQRDGREYVTRSLDKVRTMAKLADRETWWVIEKGKK